MKTIKYPSGKEVKVLTWKELRDWQDTKIKSGVILAKSKSKEK